jgi:cytidylate kinase
MPRAFKVRYKCDLKERVLRRAKQTGESFTKVEADIVKRDKDDDSRYEILYPGCHWPESDYDLVVDNSKASPEDAARAVVNGHKAWLAKMAADKVVIHEAFAPPMD